MKPPRFKQLPCRALAPACLLASVFTLPGVAQTPQPPAAVPPTAAPSASEPASPSESQPASDAVPQSFTVQPGSPADEEPSFVLQSATRRVVVDVVVTGPDGKPATGLTRSDFSVLENRKPQPIRDFEVHTPAGDLSPLPPLPAGLPVHTFMNLEPTPPSGPPVALLLDFLNTPLADQAYAHEQVIRFLETKPASTQVAIFSLGDHLSTVQGFTTDRERLVAAMRTRAASPHQAAPSATLQRAETTLDAFLEIGSLLATIGGRKNLIWFSGSFEMLVLPQARDVQEGAMFVENSTTSPSPGPGPVVTTANMAPSATTFGANEASASGFTDQIGSLTVLEDKLRKVAMALAVSQTAVYPVDVAGLQADPTFSASAASRTPFSTDARGLTGTPGMPTTPGGAPAAVQSHNDFVNALNASHATMEEIAEATGGHAFENTNGIAAAALDAVAQGGSYYTLYYEPSNDLFDGGLRTIHVSLDKPGYTLSYRSAYYAVDPSTVNPDATRRDTLTAALLHGAPQAQGLVFKAQIDPDGPPVLAQPDSPLAVKLPAKAGKRAKKDPDFLSGMVQSYTVRVAIVARQLQFVASPDGRHHAALEIGVDAYAADGRKIGGTLERLQASMPPIAFSTALQNGMFHSLKVELPVEAASLRLAISDPTSHRTGSLEIPLPLPPSEQAQAPSAAPSAR